MNEELKDYIVDVPNFPSEGSVFKDITPLLQDKDAFLKTTKGFAKLVPDDITQLVAIESRGFIFGSALAVELGIGMTLVRKPGKLPRETISHTYALEYGEDTLQIHKSALAKDQKVMIIDDVLATGGTAKAAGDLCREVGADLAGYLFLMELDFLKGREKLSAPIHSLLHYWLDPGLGTVANIFYCFTSFFREFHQIR